MFLQTNISKNRRYRTQLVSRESRTFISWCTRFGNNNEFSTADNNENAIAHKEDASTAPSQEQCTVKDDKASEEVSPKRAKLRWESHKHVMKQAYQMVKRVNLKRV